MGCRLNPAAVVQMQCFLDGDGFSLLQRERDRDLPAIFDKLQAELREFRGETAVGDDVTLLLLRRKSY